MEYANDKVFKIRYNTNLERLQIGSEGIIKRICRTLRKHKIISMAIIALIIFSIANILMIYQFVKILQNI